MVVEGHPRLPNMLLYVKLGYEVFSSEEKKIQYFCILDMFICFSQAFLLIISKITTNLIPLNLPSIEYPS